MPAENCNHARKLYASHSRVFGAASPRRACDRPHRDAASVRPARPCRASLRSPRGTSQKNLFLPRCSERACVFPAQPGGRGECAYHRRQALEPSSFQSLQPSYLLLDQAKFGLPDTEPEDGRVQDRHRLAAERVRFILGEPA